MCWRMVAARLAVVGMPRSLIEAASEWGFIGCAALRPGKGQREPWLALRLIMVDWAGTHCRL